LTAMNTVQPALTTPPPPFGWCHHIHSISTRNSIKCKQHTQHHHHLDGVTMYTAYQLATQYSATSTHNTTTSPWMVSPYTQHINSQLSTVQPAHTTPPPPLGWSHHIHSISTRNSIQSNQHTQHHHLHLDGVTIYTAYHELATQYSATSTHNTTTTWMVSPYTAYQLATQYSATSTHNNTTSPWMVSPYTQNINSQLSTVQPAHTTPPPPLGWCHHIHSIS